MGIDRWYLSIANSTCAEGGDLIGMTSALDMDSIGEKIGGVSASLIRPAATSGFK